VVLGVLASIAITDPGYADGSDAIEYLNSDKVLPTNLPFHKAVRVAKRAPLSVQIGIIRNAGSDPRHSAGKASLVHRRAAPSGSMLSATAPDDSIDE
jgi:hypothetical protein